MLPFEPLFLTALLYCNAVAVRGWFSDQNSAGHTFIFSSDWRHAEGS
jgi:hypothetical protein